MPRRLLNLTAALALAALSGCSGTAMLNATASHRTYRASTGIPYGRDARQKLDVYEPADALAAPGPTTTPSQRGRPVVVFFYGGSWQNGERGDYLFVGAALASRGFVAVLPDYRTWPATGFPGFVEDAATAVRWARDHAAEFDGDPSRIFVMGHSAGAQIAVLLATDGHYLGAQQMSKRDLSGVIGLAGPYDFLPLTDPTLEEIFPPDLRAASQPINFVSGDEPPMLLAAGKRDTTVDPGNTDRLAARLRAAGDAVEVKHYPRIGHALLVAAFAAPLRGLAPVLADVTRFIDDKAAQASQPQPQGSTERGAGPDVSNVIPLRRASMKAGTAPPAASAHETLGDSTATDTDTDAASHAE